MSNYVVVQIDMASNIVRTGIDQFDRAGGGVFIPPTVADATARNALTPEVGEIVWQADEETFYRWDGATWNPITLGGITPTNAVTATTPLAENLIVFGDAALRGVKTVGTWALDPSTNTLSVQTISTSSALLSLRNDATSSGTSFLDCVNDTGNKVFSLSSASGDRRGRMALRPADASYNGLDVRGDGYGKVGAANPVGIDTSTSWAVQPADGDSWGIRIVPQPAATVKPKGMSIETEDGVLGLAIGGTQQVQGGVDSNANGYLRADYYLVGAAPRDYGALAAAPTSPTPVAGSRYFDTAILEEMVYTGSKWVSVVTEHDGAGRNGTTPANVFYRRYNGMLMSATAGAPIHKGTLTYLNWRQAAGVNTTIEILVNNVVVGSVPTGGLASGQVVLDIDVDAGFLSLRNASTGATTTNMQIAYGLKRRV